MAEEGRLKQGIRERVREGERERERERERGVGITDCNFSSGQRRYWANTASAQQWISTPLWNCFPLMSHTPAITTTTTHRLKVNVFTMAGDCVFKLG